VLPYNKNLKKFARELRQNLTDAETFLWLKLRKRQVKNCRFYRQRIICNYIVDFYCPDAKLVIEIDGMAVNIIRNRGWPKMPRETVTWRTWDSRS
jgi:very-short-patch-repair endonuclease